MELVYIRGVASIELDAAKCNGCQECVRVCPHPVFRPLEKAVEIRDADRCMECGACVLNCSEGALSVHPGVGCAAAILKSWVTGSKQVCC